MIFLTIATKVYIFIRPPPPLAPQMLSAGLPSKDETVLSLFNYDAHKLKLNFCLECGIKWLI